MAGSGWPEQVNWEMLVGCFILFLVIFGWCFASRVCCRKQSITKGIFFLHFKQSGDGLERLSGFYCCLSLLFFVPQPEDIPSLYLLLSSIVKVKQDHKLWVVPRIVTEGISSHEDSSSGCLGENQGSFHFGGIFSHFLFWLWERKWMEISPIPYSIKNEKKEVCL